MVTDTHPVHVDQSAPQGATEMPSFWLAPELVTVAGAVIESGAVRKDLAACSIIYAWDGRDRKRRGRFIPGDVLKLADFARWLSGGMETVEDGYEFAVLVSRRAYLAGTDQRYREALLAHQLARITKKTDSDGNETWALRDPDVVEFSEVLARYGCWTSELSAAHDIMRQLPLPLTVASAPAPPPAASDTEGGDE